MIYLLACQRCQIRPAETYDSRRDEALCGLHGAGLPAIPADILADAGRPALSALVGVPCAGQCGSTVYAVPERKDLARCDSCARDRHGAVTVDRTPPATWFTDPAAPPPRAVYPTDPARVRRAAPPTNLTPWFDDPVATDAGCLACRETWTVAGDGEATRSIATHRCPPSQRGA